MYSEFDENGQMNIDTRLSSERNLEENVSVMIDFAHEVLKERGVSAVRNRHEGYGVLAESKCNLDHAIKGVSDGMKNYLNTLQNGDVQAVDTVGKIANALEDAIVAAVTMAAEAKRISDDLYDASGNGTTPLEAWIDENSGDDGFEEPEDEEQEDDENGEDAV